jgi:thiamine biosynthesis lipoprotein
MPKDLNYYMMKNFLILVFIILAISSCNQQEKLYYIKLAGFAQGTSYHITYGHSDSLNFLGQIDSILRVFDLSLSSYEPASVLSKINRNESDITDDKFLEVYHAAVEVNKVSHGAFDLTVMPLVNAWGFGPGRKTQVDQEVIDSILNYVGMEKISIEGDRLIKQDPGISIDVNAIAQGYSVDIVALFLEEQGINNYMVEIGGEVKTRGKNPKGEVWKIGIDRPEFGNFIPGMQMQAIIELNEQALATSGNYRKFYEEDGVKYSHSIDPKTGYPVRSEILSATIVAESCMKADAYATACMVMGLERSKNMLAALNDTEAYLIYGDEEGQYQVWMTPGFKKYVLKEATKQE